MISDGKLNEFVRHTYIQKNRMTQILGHFSLKFQFFRCSNESFNFETVRPDLSSKLFFEKGIIRIIPLQLVISKGRLKKL